MKQLKSLLDQYTALKKTKAENCTTAMFEKQCSWMASRLKSSTSLQVLGTLSTLKTSPSSNSRKNKSSYMAGIDKIDVAEENRKTKRNNYEMEKLCKVE